MVELAALPLLIAAGSVVFSQPEVLSRHRFALTVLGLLAALPLVQLIPLPPGVWTGLPGRDQATLALELANITPGWTPLSLSPDRTWRSFLALLPPIAAFLALLVCRKEFRLRTVHFVLAMTVLSVLVGIAQLGGGDRLYLWDTTGPGSVVGFFANRNHLATLCLMGLPFAAVLGARVLRKNGRADRRALWISILFIALMIAALGMIRSRAGVILIVPTFGASMLAAWVASGRGRPKPLLLALLGGSMVAALAVVVFAIGPILERFDTGGAPEGRFENWPTVAEAANTYLPLGSGLGSFDAVYRSVEPLERLDATYFNQAHNEYLESWLETGWLGAGLLALFFVWYGRRTLQAWAAPPGSDRDLQRAASIAVGVVLLHSFADYPIRTLTISTLFALYCGYLELAARSDSELNARGARTSHPRSASHHKVRV